MYTNHDVVERNKYDETIRVIHPGMYLLIR